MSLIIYVDAKSWIPKTSLKIFYWPHPQNSKLQWDSESEERQNKRVLYLTIPKNSQEYRAWPHPQDSVRKWKWSLISYDTKIFTSISYIAPTSRLKTKEPHILRRRPNLDTQNFSQDIYKRGSNIQINNNFFFPLLFPNPALWPEIVNNAALAGPLLGLLRALPFANSHEFVRSEISYKR